MSLQNKGNWTYEYTDENDNRFYKLYDRTNYQLSVLNLRHYKDDLTDMDHVNWEMWKSPSFCETEQHAEELLEYYDSGIFGTGFVNCITDAILKTRSFHPFQGKYKLSKEPNFA